MPRVEELSPEAVRVLVCTRHFLQRGWTQRRFETAVGARCLHRGITDAAKEVGCSLWITLAVIRVVEAAVGGCCVHWNDAPGRTQEEVLRLLDGILARTRK